MWNWKFVSLGIISLFDFSPIYSVQSLYYFKIFLISSRHVRYILDKDQEVEETIENMYDGSFQKVSNDLCDPGFWIVLGKNFRFSTIIKREADGIVKLCKYSAVYLWHLDWPLKIIRSHLILARTTILFSIPVSILTFSTSILAVVAHRFRPYLYLYKKIPLQTTWISDSFQTTRRSE